MNDYEYQEFILKTKSLLGIDLSLYKETQMKRRLIAHINKLGFKSFQLFLDTLRTNESLRNDFLDRITINVTEFFRNPNRWDILEKEILPDLYKQTSHLKCWSAACSSGEEPYTLSMLLKEKFPSKSFSILATDIDKNILEQAKTGVYNHYSTKDVQSYYLQKYFTKENELHKIDSKLKNEIKFKQHDLLKDSFESEYDLIICRNVMIYFTEEAKHELYQKFARALKKDGILFVGSTEQIFTPQQYGLDVKESFFYVKK